MNNGSLEHLLKECETATPPYEHLIASTLSNLKSSRFHFAIEIQLALSSLTQENQRFQNEDEIKRIRSNSIVSLNLKQRQCLIYTLMTIGNGFTTQHPFNSQNAFLGLFKRYEKDLQDVLEQEEVPSPNIQILLQELQEQRYPIPQPNYISMVQPAFYRPSPISKKPETNAYENITSSSPIIPSSSPSPLSSLHFIHTSYPSLRYQWMPRRDYDDLYSDTNPISSNEKSGKHNEDLIKKSLHQPLEMEEEDLLLRILQQHQFHEQDTSDSNRESMKTNIKTPISFITPDNLPSLVQHNPNIAIEFLVRLHDDCEDGDSSKNSSDGHSCKRKKNNISKGTSSGIESLYHSSLVNMDITLHTMEIVYKLATNHVLDTEYLHVFVLGLFERCKRKIGMTTGSNPNVNNDNQRMTLTGVPVSSTSMAEFGAQMGDTVVTDRKIIRLVSVFLQNLIQNSIVNIDDFVEIQAFCIENSRVREANALFKLLKEKRVGYQNKIQPQQSNISYSMNGNSFGKKISKGREFK